MQVGACCLGTLERHEADSVTAVQLECRIANETGDPKFLRIDVRAHETVALWCPNHGLELRAHSVLLRIACGEPCIFDTSSSDGAHRYDLWQNEANFLPSALARGRH